MSTLDKMAEVLRLLREIRADIESETKGAVNPKLRWCNQYADDLKEMERTVAKDFAFVSRVLTPPPTLEQLQEAFQRTDI